MSNIAGGLPCVSSVSSLLNFALVGGRTVLALLLVLVACTAPDGESTRIVEFETDEGTAMSVDVSPDGKEIAFDLLGDIYVVPINGGTARVIVDGSTWDH